MCCSFVPWLCCFVASLLCRYVGMLVCWFAAPWFMVPGFMRHGAIIHGVLGSHGFVVLSGVWWFFFVDVLLDRGVVV